MFRALDEVVAESNIPLSRIEKLQLVNLRPTTAIEIIKVVEECEERYSEDVRERMLEAIQTHLPEPQHNLYEIEEDPYQNRTTNGSSSKSEKAPMEEEKEESKQ